LLCSVDSIVREHTLQMLREAGRSECMTPLLFDSSDGLVARVQRYVLEIEGREDGKSSR
jgi:hypothetical protein